MKTLLLWRSSRLNAEALLRLRRRLPSPRALDSDSSRHIYREPSSHIIIRKAMTSPKRRRRLPTMQSESGVEHTALLSFSGAAHVGLHLGVIDATDSTLIFKAGSGKGHIGLIVSRFANQFGWKWNQGSIQLSFHTEQHRFVRYLRCSAFKNSHINFILAQVKRLLLAIRPHLAPPALQPLLKLRPIVLADCRNST